MDSDYTCSESRIMSGEVNSKMPTIPNHINEFLSQTLVAVVSTVDADGSPRSAPIWYHWEDGSAYMFTGRRTLKWRNIMRKSSSLALR